MVLKATHKFRDIISFFSIHWFGVYEYATFTQYTVMTLWVCAYTKPIKTHKKNYGLLMFAPAVINLQLGHGGRKRIDMLTNDKTIHI